MVIFRRGTVRKEDNMNRFTTEPHADGYAIRDGELICDTKGETLVYPTQELAAYFAEVIHRAVYPTLRRNA